MKKLRMHAVVGRMQAPSTSTCVATLGAALLLVHLWRRRRPRFAFDGPLDRSGVHTVKHELPVLMHGEAAVEALNMWVADMELPCCDRIRGAIMDRAQHPTFGYTIQPREIWSRVGRWMVERQGHPSAPDPSSFVFSASVVTSFWNVLEACTAPGDRVLLMTPLYAPLQQAVSSSGRVLVPHALQLSQERGRYEIDLPRLEADLQGVSLLLLCSPHNPSGTVWRRSELAAVASACARRGVTLVADEIWADWPLPGAEPFVPCRAVVPADGGGPRLITLGAPTKSWSLAGLHASFLVIEDDELRQQYTRRALPAFLAFGSTFATTAMLAAYEHGAPWLDAARAHVRANVDVLCSLLRAHVPEVVPLPPEATYLVWLDCSRLGLAPAALHDFLLRRAKLHLSAGEEFAPEAAQFMRINVACSRPMLLEAVGRLRRAVETLREQHLKRILDLD
tara:strand:- start:908 stop:2257 length:1350 start_codon:yes stop_codon:yes gene_type:complete